MKSKILISVLSLSMVCTLVAVGCKKKETPPATPPAASNTSSTPAPSSPAPATPTPTPTTPPAPTASASDFSSPEGKFSVQLPKGFDAPKQSKSPITTDAGTIDMTNFLSENPTGAMMIMYGDFPKEVFQKKSVKQMMDDGRDNAVRSVNGKLVKEEETVFEGSPRRSIYLSATAAGKEVHARFDFIIIGTRLYEVAYLGYNAAELEKPEVKSYFDSFKLIK